MNDSYCTYDVICIKNIKSLYHPALVVVMSSCTVGHLTCLLPELQEELLIEDEGHSADLLHFGLSCGVTVDEVCGNGDG